MNGAPLRHLLSSCSLLVALSLSGCAAQRSVIVLLPEDGKVSGEIMVVNAGGSQLLNRSWQSVAIAGPRGEPTKPAVMRAAAVHELFGPLLGAAPAQPVHYLLFFRLDTAELLPESQLLLPEIVRVIRERSPAQLSVVGHTDTTGSVEHNYRLGLLRATLVAGLLLSQGAAPVSVETASRGKADLLVKTPAQTLEPRIRRAEVTVR